MKKLKNNFLSYLVISIPLVIPLLITGPFLTDLLVSLSSLVFVIYIFKNNLFFFLNRKPLIIFYVFCIYCIILSIFIAEDKSLSLKSSLFYVRIGLFSCLIWYLVELNKKILKYFYYAFVFSFSVLLLDGYFQFFTGFNILGYPKYNGVRLSSFFGYEYILGSYLSRLLPLFLALFIIKKKSMSESNFFLVLFFLTYILIYLSGERAAFFFLNLSMISIILLFKNYKKIRIIVFMVTIISVVFISFFNDTVRNRMITYTFDQINISQKHEQKYIFSPEHDSLIRTAYKMFQDKPIFGHGPKMFRKICKVEKYRVGSMPCNTHPHNFYIQLLAETGVVGFMFLLVALVYVIYSLFKQLLSIIFQRKRHLTDFQVSLIACMFITLWPVAPSGNFFNNWLAICYSLPVGFYLFSIYGKNKEEILEEFKK